MTDRDNPNRLHCRWEEGFESTAENVGGHLCVPEGVTLQSVGSGVLDRALEQNLEK